MSNDKVITFTDAAGNVQQFDTVAGVLLDHTPDGVVEMRQVPIRDEILVALAAYANKYDRRLAFAEEAGGIRIRDGQLVKMDLGPTDVHIDATMSNVMFGYAPQEGIADVASPIVSAVKASNKYFTWNQDDALQGAGDLIVAPGAEVGEVNPRLSSSNYNAIPYGKGAFIDTETQANADAPIQPFQAAVRRCLNLLRIAREERVSTLLTTTGSYSGGNLIDLTGDATTKWNGGANSDPIANIQSIIDAALMEPTDLLISRKVWHAMQRNPAVRAYYAYKSQGAPIPSTGEMSAILELPTIHVGKMKHKTGSSTYDYIWGNDVALIRRPPVGVPVDGQDIGSSYTYRWNGTNGSVPDGNFQGGFVVRMFFQAHRGPRGGQKIVVTHNDAELLTSAVVGGLIHGAYQLPVTFTGYITQAALEARLTAAKVLMAYDDGDGAVNTTALGGNILSASALVDSFLARSFSGPFPLSVDPNTGAYPVLVQEATLLFVISMTNDRAPEVMREYGEKYLLGLRKMATDLCEAIAVGMNQVVESTPAKTNLLKGGIVYDSGPRLIVDGPNGQCNGGDF